MPDDQNNLRLDQTEYMRNAMKKIAIATVLFALAGGAAYAADDVAQGEKDFKKCKACHSIISPDGEKIVKGGVIGPNLFGVVGRPAGGDPEFGKYDDTMMELAEGGLVWTPENMAAYIPNAKDFLSEQSGEKAKTKMTPQKVKDVTDVIAYLAQFSE
jgi:cytochrome c